MDLSSAVAIERTVEIEYDKIDSERWTIELQSLQTIATESGILGNTQARLDVVLTYQGPGEQGELFDLVFELRQGERSVDWLRSPCLESSDALSPETMIPAQTPTPAVICFEADNLDGVDAIGIRPLVDDPLIVPLS